MSNSVVTDHAIVRYLERVYGVDVNSLRKRIADITKDGREAGASAIISDGVRYTLDAKGKVVSVTGHGEEMPKRGKRWQRRHK